MKKWYLIAICLLWLAIPQLLLAGVPAKKPSLLGRWLVLKRVHKNGMKVPTPPGLKVYFSIHKGGVFYSKSVMKAGGRVTVRPAKGTWKKTKAGHISFTINKEAKLFRFSLAAKQLVLTDVKDGEKWVMQRQN